MSEDQKCSHPCSLCADYGYENGKLDERKQLLKKVEDVIVFVFAKHTQHLRVSNALSKYKWRRSVAKFNEIENELKQKLREAIES